MQTNFADGIVHIAISGPLIRIDFGTLVSALNADGKQEARLEASQRLVMPLEGFVRAIGLQEQVIRKLVADGVLTVQRGEGPPPADTH